MRRFRPTVTRAFASALISEIGLFYLQRLGERLGLFSRMTYNFKREGGICPVFSTRLNRSVVGISRLGRRFRSSVLFPSGPGALFEANDIRALCTSTGVKSLQAPESLPADKGNGGSLRSFGGIGYSFTPHCAFRCLCALLGDSFPLCPTVVRTLFASDEAQVSLTI